MTHAFSQSEHPFGQCGHFNQIEPFKNPRFLVMVFFPNQQHFLLFLALYP
jgi:hypothetical protein